MTPDLFIGVVTYPGTRFPDASGPEGLATQISRALAAAGLDTTIEFASENLYEESVFPIDREAVKRSIEAELNTEALWRAFLRSSRPSIKDRSVMTLRGHYRRRKYLPSNGKEITSSDPGSLMIRRLINIELAHMGLLRSAVASGAAWTLILEDDAEARDSDEFGKNLMAFIDRHQGKAQPSYVNISESFSSNSLGIEHLLHAVEPWNADDNACMLFSSDLPVTNTVCAILYRKQFLRQLLDTMESIPIDPVIPIDWKLNQALMNLVQDGIIASGDSWITMPAPIVQRSML